MGKINYLFQGFVFLVASPESDDLHIRVLDTAKKDSVVGTAVVRISDVVRMNGLEMPTQVR